MFKRLFILFSVFALILQPLGASAEVAFNPHYIISDTEMQDTGNWNRNDVLNFLVKKGSFLASYITEDANGIIKSAADIIYDAAQRYKINPKFLLVTLQKEQSLITDDAPTQKQLDWATGYAVCDGCYLSDPKVVKHKGFGKQVDDAAGIMRWYYDNKDISGVVKKKDTPIRIDNTQVVPQSWATAFLYTYTPHLHGNKNFWRIWNTWYSQFFPNGTLFKSASSSEYWLVDNGFIRKFKNQTVLITRADPKLALTVTNSELLNYKTGPEISYPNYSLLQTPYNTYLLDYDTLRPFASAEVVRALGFNPEEMIEADETELSSYPRGAVITADSINPQGVIYFISGLRQPYYLVKDGKANVILDKKIMDTIYKNLTVEKHALKDLEKFELADEVINFPDGTILQVQETGKKYVVDQGKKRLFADADTFTSMGYKKTNLIKISAEFSLTLPTGEPVYLSSELLSNKDKFLGDSEAPVSDLYKTKIPAYLVAEYPSGRILSGKNIDTVRPIASLTKLLTAYEALNQDFEFDGTLTYDDKKYASEGNPLKLKTGEKLKGRDAFNAMLVGSINNLARLVAGNSGMSEKEFIKSINERLSDWGADNTSITDVTGLDAGNKSTARDVLKIFVKVTKDEKIKTALQKTDYTFKETLDKNGVRSHKVNNTNQLLKISGRSYRILAGKTGYTDEAQAVIALLIESKKTKKQYVVITLGNSDYKNRFLEPNKIAEWISKTNLKITSE